MLARKSGENQNPNARVSLMAAFRSQPLKLKKAEDDPSSPPSDVEEGEESESLSHPTITSYADLHSSLATFLLKKESERGNIRERERESVEDLILNLVDCLWSAEQSCKEEDEDEEVEVEEKEKKESERRFVSRKMTIDDDDEEEEQGDESSNSGKKKKDKKRRRITFASGTLQVVTPPNISIAGSERPCFSLTCSLRSAILITKELEHRLQAELQCDSQAMSEKPSQVLKDVISFLKRQKYSTPYFTCPSTFLSECLRGILDQEHSLNLYQRTHAVVESAIRFILRKLFNRPSKRYYMSGDSDSEVDEEVVEEQAEDERAVQLEFADMGSYEYNNDDIAAVIRDALVVMHDTLPSANKWSDLQHKRKNNGAKRREVEHGSERQRMSHVHTASAAKDLGDKDEDGDEMEVEIRKLVPSLYMFVHAHSFLRDLFIENQHIGSAIWEKKELAKFYSICSELVEKLQMESQYPFLALRKPLNFIRQLESLQELADRVQDWLDSHETMSPKESGWSEKKRKHAVMDCGSQHKAASFRFPHLYIVEDEERQQDEGFQGLLTDAFGSD